MTKKSFNHEAEFVLYRAEKRYKDGRWGPARLFGHIMEKPTKELLADTIQYWRPVKNRRTGERYLSGRIRIVKITRKVTSHTTITKEPV